MFFYTAFRKRCLTYLKVLNEGSESEVYTVATGNNSGFTNLEARTSILNICNRLYIANQESNHLGNDAKVLKMLLGASVSALVAHIAPSASPAKPKSQSHYIRSLL